MQPHNISAEGVTWTLFQVILRAGIPKEILSRLMVNYVCLDDCLSVPHIRSGRVLRKTLKDHTWQWMQSGKSDYMYGLWYLWACLLWQRCSNTDFNLLKVWRGKARFSEEPAEWLWYLISWGLRCQIANHTLLICDDQLIPSKRAYVCMPQQHFAVYPTRRHKPR